MATNYQGFQFNQNSVPQQPMFQSQQFFPQPQGNIYLINNSLEMANVPTIGTGISAALCLSEGVMYLKTMQNGAPAFIGYNVTPFDSKDNPTTKTQQQNEDTHNISNYMDRLERLEKEIETLKQKTGCNLSELIQ